MIPGDFEWRDKHKSIFPDKYRKWHEYPWNLAVDIVVGMGVPDPGEVLSRVHIQTLVKYVHRIKGVTRDLLLFRYEEKMDIPEISKRAGMDQKTVNRMLALQIKELSSKSDRFVLGFNGSSHDLKEEAESLQKKVAEQGKELKETALELESLQKKYREQEEQAAIFRKEKEELMEQYLTALKEKKFQVSTGRSWMESISIESLELSTRAQNVLHRHNIMTLQDLAAYDIETLSGMSGMGGRTLQNVRETLDSYNSKDLRPPHCIKTEITCAGVVNPYCTESRPRRPLSRIIRNLL